MTARGGTCKGCGCTNEAACVHKSSGRPCWWVTDDTCAGCAPGVDPDEWERPFPALNAAVDVQEAS